MSIADTWSHSLTARTVGSRYEPSVCLAGAADRLASPGGGEIQMLSTARALRGAGVRARLWQAPEDPLVEADCLHLFGSLPEHRPLVEVAYRQGIPVVLSTIAWFDLVSYWREPRPLVGRALAAAKFLARATCPALPSWRRRLYHEVDLLLPNSSAEAQQLVRYFGVPASRIHVVPNGAEERFSAADPTPFCELLAVEDYVLYAGRIEPRKNQLAFLRAMEDADVPIVVLGDAAPGHEAYLAQCLRIAGPNVQFVGRLEHDDPLLAAAYAGAGCLALASWYETPGLVALEAAMSGTPLVLPAIGCAREYFGDHALYVRPDDPAGIREAVLTALGRGRSQSLANYVRENFSWTAAARATREAYDKVL
ncbi:MAG: glycosyltransferase [Pirellulales bacterium]|nr:glycosyltransferase [Pirellulales bacterium]